MPSPVLSRGHWLLLVAILLGSGATQLSPELDSLLRYQRQEILGGELWRLLTANFSHTNLNHWLLNLTGLGLSLFITHRPLPAGRFALTLIISGLASTAGLLPNAEVTWYSGMSGALHGLFLHLAIWEWRGKQPLSGITLLSLITIKLIWEQLAGAEAFTSTLIGSDIIVDAHLWGAVGGAVAAVPLLFTGKARSAY